MIMMLMIIIINCLLSLLSVPREYKAAALYSDMSCVDSEFIGAYLLALGVQGRGGLVQEQDLGVAYDGPGDGDALLLTARQLGALGADVGVVFLRREHRAISNNNNDEGLQLGSVCFVET